MEVSMLPYKNNHAVKRMHYTGLFFLAALLPAMLVLLLCGCRPSGIGIDTGNGPDTGSGPGPGTSSGPNVPVPAAVTYHLNGGTNGTAPVDSKTYSTGDEVTVQYAPVAQPPGGAAEGFFGWSTSPHGFGRFYAAGSSFTITKDTDLYALWSGNGTNAAYPKLGSTAAQLTAIGTNAHFALVDDVTMTAPVTASQFSGTFDGRGHTVTLNITTGGSIGLYGLFSSVAAGNSSVMIQNVHVTGSITADGAGSSMIIAGGIAGLLSGTQNSITLKNCMSSVNITVNPGQAMPYVYAGGLVGVVNDTPAILQHCYTSGNIVTTASFVDEDREYFAGGILGYAGSSAANGRTTVTYMVSLAAVNWTLRDTTRDSRTDDARRVAAKKAVTGAGAVTINNCYGKENNAVSMTANGQSVAHVVDAVLDGTTLTMANAEDETWWNNVWRDVWGGDSPAPEKPWTWAADVKRPKLYGVD